MSNFYCAAPWRSLHINSRGDIKTCCAGNPNMLGNLNDKGIEEILNGPELIEIRSALRQGIPHEKYCSNCVNGESRGGESERAWHNRINEHFDTSQAGLAYEYPTLMDVRWNNTCNLSCNYCGPNDSSKWAALKKIPVNTNTRHYYTDVCDFLEKNNSHIKEVALIGGEPLLLPENERLLDVIPDNCVITLITNLSNPLEDNKIFQKLSKKRNVGWSISFDNIQDRFEYVRHGATWALMQHNLDLIQNLIKNQGHWGGIHPVYNLYNCTRLCEFVEFAQGRNLSLKWQTLHWPAVLDPRNYGQEIATLAAAEIEKLLSGYPIKKEEKHMFQNTLAHYQSQTNNDPVQLTKLKLFVAEIEQYHPGQQGQFAKLWPELQQVLT
jgi:MoaA/NifB/PqqE/SkfB family radical SAM enzyme